MLTIPAIDILDGRCVRLSEGDFERKTVYSENPSDVAKTFADAGLSLVHVVDLDGAKAGRIANWRSIEAVLRVPGVTAEVGGGVRTSDDIRRLLDLGVHRVVVGSVAAKSPELAAYWIEQFGADRIVIGMDVRNGSVAVSGWLEDSHRTPVDFLLDLKKRGARTFICTDIARDGTMQGTNVEFFRSLTGALPAVDLIASGGIASVGDIRRLREAGVSGVVVGKALYEGRIRLEDLTDHKA